MDSSASGQRWPEGSRKADSATALGLACITPSGVDCWRGTNPDGGKTALPDWADVALNDRRVMLAFDGDVTRNPNVRRALGGLARYLASKDAKVECLWLPDTTRRRGSTTWPAPVGASWRRGPNWPPPEGWGQQGTWGW